MKTFAFVAAALAAAAVAAEEPAAATAAATVEKLPAEVAALPGEQVLDVTDRIYAYKPSGGFERKDPESPTGKAAVYLAKNAEGEGGVGMGVYDPKLHKETKKVVAYSRFPMPDENYHWYKIKWEPEASDGVVGVDSQVYVENWAIGVRLGEITGRYDYWICLKAEGPVYVAGSVKENAVYLCRAVLVKR